MRFFDSLSALPLDVVVPTLLGVVLAYGTALYTGTLIVFGWISRWWPTVEGVVTESRAVDTNTRRFRGNRSSYRVSTRYRYEVGGRTYTGDRVFFGDAFNRYAGSAVASATFITPGARVAVRYLPGFPSVATIRAKTAWQMWFFAICGTLVGTLWLQDLFP